MRAAFIETFGSTDQIRRGQPPRRPDHAVGRPVLRP